MNKTVLITNLRGIFESITPDEILENEIFRDSMEIFCSVLEKFSDSSIDISRQLRDEFFKEEFFKTYNAILYDTLNKLKTNNGFWDQNARYQEIQNADLLNLDVINNPHVHLPENMLLTFRKFFEIKGVHEGIEFIYDWIGSHTPEKIDFLDIQEKGPFRLEIEGNMARQVYDYFVRVLQHPVGFQYTYTKLERIDLDRQNEMEWYQNQNNEYQITPQNIDKFRFFKEHNNPNLREFTQENFPDFVQFSEPFKYDFKRLEFMIQDFKTYEIKILDFLFDMNSEQEHILVNNEKVPVLVNDYKVNDQLTFMERTWVFDSGKELVFKETYAYDVRELVLRHSQTKELIFQLGQNESVEVSENGIEFSIIDPRTSVLDYLYQTEKQWLPDDIIERTQEPLLSGDLTLRGLSTNTELLDKDPLQNPDKVDNLDTNNRSSIPSLGWDYTHFIEFHNLDNKHKPLRLDFKPRMFPSQKETPYSNDVLDAGTLQESAYFGPERESWSSQYFDWNLPQRSTENCMSVFQNCQESQKFWYSPMHYETWQLFSGNEIQGKKMWGYWTNPKTRWKFIGQENVDGETTVLVGDEDLHVNRGVRKYSFDQIPGFTKLPPLQGSKNYEQQKDNLEMDRAYWQAQGDIFIPKVGEVHPIKIGDLAEVGYQLYVGQNQGNSTDAESIQYQEFLQWRMSSQNEEYAQGFQEWENGDIYWFEQPRPRQTPQGSDVHTFYRGLSPRQEEMNYMHFNVTENSDMDPVNLQYRTLEQFDVKVFKYSGDDIIEILGTNQTH